MSRPRSRTTRSACAWTAGGAPSTSRASTTPARTSRQWKMRRCIFMNGSTLVSTGDLAANFPKWRVFDCRHDLANPDLGEQQYKEGHIPGALFAHLERDLSGRKTGANGRHPLPDPQAFEKWLEHTALTPRDQAVRYDAGPGSTAARPWWMLPWIGDETVSVLGAGVTCGTRGGRSVTCYVLPLTTSSPPIAAPTVLALEVVTVEKSLPTSLSPDARGAAPSRSEPEPIGPAAG